MENERGGKWKAGSAVSDGGADSDMETSVEHTADISDATALNQESMFSESSSEDEDDDKTNKEDIYVNLVGKKIMEDDERRSQELKESMKEFLSKCSPDMSFSSLVQYFVQQLPQTKTIYVLSSDVCPKTLDPNRRYAIVCAVPGCNNAYIRDGSDWENIEQTKNFFGFPPNPDQCNMWITSIRRPRYLKRTTDEIQNYRICEDHFTDGHFTSGYKDELTEHAVPKLLLNSAEDSTI